MSYLQRLFKVVAKPRDFTDDELAYIAEQIREGYTSGDRQRKLLVREPKNKAEQDWRNSLSPKTHQYPRWNLVYKKDMKLDKIADQIERGIEDGHEGGQYWVLKEY
jgi:hypothetical protein